MSDKREFPILNGKLLSDLDLNGHKLLGLNIPEGGGGGGSSVIVDETLTKDGENPVKSKGIWSAIWGAISAPAASVYAWVTAELGKKQDKLKQGDNITIDEDGTISATGGGSDVDVVAEIAGKEIKPKRVVVENGDTAITLNDDDLFKVRHENENIIQNAQIMRSDGDINISFQSMNFSEGSSEHDAYASYKCSGFGINRRNPDGTYHNFSVSVETGSVFYVGTNSQDGIENTIANMVNAMPRYRFVEADWVVGDADIDVDDGKATFLFVKKYHNSYYDTSSSNLQNLFIITPEDETSGGLTRDAVLVIDMPEGSEPSVDWNMDVYPRGGDASNLEVVAGKRNVFFITEVQPNVFMVARDELALPEGEGEPEA